MNFFTHLFSTCDLAILQIYFLGGPSHKGPISKMATQKACGHNNTRTDSGIAAIFDKMVHYVFLMIRKTFGMDPLKTKWLPQSFKEMIGGGGGGYYSLIIFLIYT